MSLQHIKSETPMSTSPVGSKFKIVRFAVRCLNPSHHSCKKSVQCPHKLEENYLHMVPMPAKERNCYT